VRFKRKADDKEFAKGKEGGVRFLVGFSCFLVHIEFFQTDHDEAFNYPFLDFFETEAIGIKLSLGFYLVANNERSWARKLKLAIGAAWHM